MTAEIDPAADVDVVLAVLPDGSRRVVKGAATLERIIARNRAEDAQVQFVHVTSEADADELTRRHGAH